tara:strand:+ start:372 stop:953 length:582 start_codon:yes stop_codon:yes gene_type:complete
MRETTVKISVTQDGLLPEEVTLLGKIFLPVIQKQILRSCGFEKIDDSTFAGVVPIKVTANAKMQEIEFEVGAIPDFRKKVVEFINEVSLLEFEEPEPVKEPEVEEKKTRIKKKAKSDTKSKVKKDAAKPAAKKAVAKPATKKPATKKSAAKKPVAKKSTTKKPVTKKSATKKTVAKKPVKKKSTAVKAKRAKK